MIGGAKPTLLGLASGGAFALAAIGFRGAILSLNLPDYVMAATFTLVIGLAMQSVALSLYLSLRLPAVLFALLRAWKPSLFTGFMGALASQFWFLAFALATAASVRTLALIEVLFAQVGALRLWPTHQHPRSHRHGARGRRRGASYSGLLKNNHPAARPVRRQFLSSGKIGSA